MANFFDENISPSVTGEVDAALVSLGQRGAIAVDGVAPGGNFAAIQCLTECEFDGLTALNSDFSLILTPFLVPAGTIFYGPFTSISATMGSIYIAYKAG
jgi:hypothetical protein